MSDAAGMDICIHEMCEKLGSDMGDDQAGWRDRESCLREIKGRLDAIQLLPGEFRRLAEESLGEVSPALRGVWHGEHGVMADTFKAAAKAVEKALGGSK